MIIEPFEYYAPETIEEALELLTKYPSTSRLLSGGQSLIPLMNLGLAGPKQIIDLKRIAGKKLAYITEEKDEVRIGALTTHFELGSSPIIAEHCPILVEAALSIGDAQVRNRGTLGGSVCHADPSADYPPVLLALDAKFNTSAVSNGRTIDAAEFFIDAFTTAMKPDEIMTEIVVRKKFAGHHTGSAFMKFSYVEGAFSIVSAASYLSIDKGSVPRCKAIKVALGGVQTSPLVLKGVETQLVGREVNEAFYEAAGAIARQSITSPLSDVQADGAYRTELGRVFTMRTLRKAFEHCIRGREGDVDGQY